MTWHLSLENIAGIREGAASIEPGVNAVRASNWQGKSSFLAGIKTAFGTVKPLTEGQSTGRAVLETDDDNDEVVVELERTNGTVSRSGNPYLDEEYDRICASLFAFLGEENEIRHAVRVGKNVESALTQPLDFENIDEQIADLRAERDQVEHELERAAQAADRLPQLQQRVTGLEGDLEELRTERENLDSDAGAESDAREQLSDFRAERDRLTAKIDRLETTAERVRDTLSEKRAELESLTVHSGDAVETELEQLNDDLRDIERDRELLQSVYEANKRVLDEGRVELLTAVSHDMLADSVTCWLCGNDATRDDLEAQLSVLDDRIAELRSQAAEIQDRVDELEAKQDEFKTAQRRETDLTDRIGDLESRLAETEESLELAQERRDDLDSRITELEAEVDSTDDRITDLESEIKYTEAELADARAELDESESFAEQRDTLEEEYDALAADIADLRNRKEEIKRRTREAFSSALTDLLEQFDTGFETARLTSSFDLVVAREGREAQLDALSEGERELLGIVAALAGHEAFEVGQRVPVMLLDGLGGLASDNLQILVKYLADRAEYLVLTAYPENEGFDANELSPSNWQVVSRESDVEATP
ncbi:archaea-specific SMC-related protein [Natrialba taiwanensis]|uniref:Chromosome segregation ATPase-like protein n=1 Tax=Natrialba taiwanensis DSM 12281 TaxID=1230458 RepID=M0AEJ7_9EURY|nr:archaea-specific SMC-related protein [Natrialba taiwanensis]ELY96297.1 chromosome segregation ATPase-like protein [Natrialba taiwanensis DSM 12281]